VKRRRRRVRTSSSGRRRLRSKESGRRMI
jgi:hypothetical protein